MNGARNAAWALNAIATPNQITIVSGRRETADATAITQAADQMASHCPNPAALIATLGSTSSQSIASGQSLSALRSNWRAATARHRVPATDRALIRLILGTNAASGLTRAR